MFYCYRSSCSFKKNEHLFHIVLSLREIIFRCVRALAHLRALTTQRSCAIGMRNAMLRNHLNTTPNLKKKCHPWHLTCDTKYSSPIYTGLCIRIVQQVNPRVGWSGPAPYRPLNITVHLSIRMFMILYHKESLSQHSENKCLNTQKKTKFLV